MKLWKHYFWVFCLISKHPDFFIIILRMFILGYINILEKNNNN